MSELATRAKELAKQLFTHSCVQAAPICTCEYALIEQALLAERRLAMEDAIVISENESVEYVGPGDDAYNSAIIHVTKALRAAAEKEVSK